MTEILNANPDMLLGSLEIAGIYTLFIGHWFVLLIGFFLVACSRSQRVGAFVSNVAILVDLRDFALMRPKLAVFAGFSLLFVVSSLTSIHYPELLVINSDAPWEALAAAAAVTLFVIILYLKVMVPYGQKLHSNGAQM